MHRTQKLIAELREHSAKLLRGSTPAHAVLMELGKQLHRYAEHQDTTREFERDLQFLFILAAKELDADPIDVHALEGVVRRVEQLLSGQD
jgi:hypothetical protein